MRALNPFIDNLLFHVDNIDSGDDASVSSDSDDVESEVDEIEGAHAGVATYLEDYSRGQVVYEDDLQYIAAEVASAGFEAPALGMSMLTSIPVSEPRRALESSTSSGTESESTSDHDDANEEEVNDPAEADDDADNEVESTVPTPKPASNKARTRGKGKERLHRADDDSGALEEMLAEEEEEGAGAANGVPMTKHESLEEPMVSTEADINAMRPDDDLVLCGEVKSFIPEEGAVVIQSYHTTSPLNEGSLLCCIVPKESKGASASPIIPSKAAGTRISASAVPPEKSEIVVLGRIAELFGPLFSPFYVIRYANTILPSLLEAASSNREGGAPSASGGGKKARRQRSRGQKAKGALESAAPMDVGEVTDGIKDVPGSSADVDVVQDPVVVVEGNHDASASTAVFKNDSIVPTKSSSPEPSEADKRKALYAKIGRIPTSTQVFCVQRCATLVQTDLLKSMSGKGSDASNMFDEEVKIALELFALAYSLLTRMHFRWVVAR